MKKNILIINANPDKNSLGFKLSEAYYTGAKKTAENVSLVNLFDLDFEINLKYGYKTMPEMEPDLAEIQNKINEAQHLVFVLPVWWGTYPALLKGFIDRVFIPGFAFKYRKDSPFPEKLLTGKSARLIITSDTPDLYSRFVYKQPAQNSLKKAVLQFCGVNPVRTIHISPVKRLSELKIKNYLSKIELFGEKNI